MEPTSTIAVTPADRTLLAILLRQYVPHSTVWAYGSRVDGTSRAASDLDLVIHGVAPAVLSNLREAMEESNLTFRVDLFSWDDLPPEFQQRIHQCYAVVQPAG